MFQESRRDISAQFLLVPLSPANQTERIGDDPNRQGDCKDDDREPRRDEHEGPCAQCADPRVARRPSGRVREAHFCAYQGRLNSCNEELQERLGVQEAFPER